MTNTLFFKKRLVSIRSSIFFLALKEKSCSLLTKKELYHTLVGAAYFSKTRMWVFFKFAQLSGGNLHEAKLKIKLGLPQNWECSSSDKLFDTTGWWRCPLYHNEGCFLDTLQHYFHILLFSVTSATDIHKHLVLISLFITARVSFCSCVHLVIFIL